MKSIVIYTDYRKIKEETAVLSNMTVAYQSINEAFREVKIIPTIEDIGRLLSSFDLRTIADKINSYVLNKLVDAASPYELNGITLTREAVQNMIATPNTDEIKARIIESVRHFTADITGVRENLLTTVDGIIVKKPDAIDIITKIYSYSAKTEKSIQLAASLQKVCDSMNEFASHHGNYFDKLLTDYKRIYSKDAMPGLTIDNNMVVVCHKYIHAFEQNGGNRPYFI